MPNHHAHATLVTQHSSSVLVNCCTVCRPKGVCEHQEKEDWINAVGRAIVRHSKRYGPAKPYSMPWRMLRHGSSQQC